MGRPDERSGGRAVPPARPTRYCVWKRCLLLLAPELFGSKERPNLATPSFNSPLLLRESRRCRDNDARFDAGGGTRHPARHQSYNT
mmetsp:Transcript_45345/g.88632  ORF Transcript_45345/g.88632 Transcript_45345/m.88632 type:complete len:86 (+) Transcript_45345:97-354(+)